MSQVGAPAPVSYREPESGALLAVSYPRRLARRNPPEYQRALRIYGAYTDPANFYGVELLYGSDATGPTRIPVPIWAGVWTERQARNRKRRELPVKYLTLKVVPAQVDETLPNFRLQLLVVLQGALNEGLPVPQLVDRVREWTAQQPLRYRATLLDLITSTEPLPFKETVARLRLLDILEPLKDGDVAAFEDAEHETLTGIMGTVRIPVSREWVRFVEDVNAGADSLPQITAASLVEDDEEPPPEPRNGRVLSVVGSN